MSIANERARRRRLDAVRDNAALIALVALLALGFARHAAFLTPENLINILRQNSMLGLIALGMTFVILTGGIDLSVGAVAAVAGVIAARLVDYGAVAAVLAAVTAALGIGALNGLLVVRARIQPFVVTLATMIAARGLALAATGDETVAIGRRAPDFTWLGRGMIGPVPVPVLLLGLALVVCVVVLGHTRFGRQVYAVGDSADSARLMGLPVGRVTFTVYAVSGALAGLAGVLLTARLGAGQPVAASGWELDAIAAVVIGGTLLTGGRGRIASSIVGVLLLGTVFNLFNLEGTITPWWQWVMRGAFLLVFVIFQSRLGRRSVLDQGGVQ